MEWQYMKGITISNRAVNKQKEVRSHLTLSLL